MDSFLGVWVARLTGALRPGSADLGSMLVRNPTTTPPTLFEPGKAQPLQLHISLKMSLENERSPRISRGIIPSLPRLALSSRPLHPLPQPWRPPLPQLPPRSVSLQRARVRRNLRLVRVLRRRKLTAPPPLQYSQRQPTLKISWACNEDKVEWFRFCLASQCIDEGSFFSNTTQLHDRDNCPRMPSIVLEKPRETDADPTVASRGIYNDESLE